MGAGDIASCDDLVGAEARAKLLDKIPGTIFAALKNDLAHHPTACALDYLDRPLFSSGAAHGNLPLMKAFWQILYAAAADIVQHGIREFIVGTGGRNFHRLFGTVQPNSEVRNADTAAFSSSRYILKIMIGNSSQKLEGSLLTRAAERATSNLLDGQPSSNR